MIDIDGVLADFVGRACEVHGRPNPFLKEESRGCYDMAVLWGISLDEFFAPLDLAFWSNLDPLPDSEAILSHCEDVFGRENVAFCSCPSKNPDSLSGKMAWIKRFHPNYLRRFIFTPKKYFAAHPESVLVDDQDNNIDLFIEHGGKGLLLPRPWNSNYAHDPIGFLKGFLHGLHHHKTGKNL